MMGATLRRLILGLALIIGASAVLLLSDLGSRVSERSGGTIPGVSFLQQASQAVLDDGVRGMIQGLAEGGYVDGKSVKIRRYNAEGDAGTSNTIARQMANSDDALLITISTPSLQAVANANRTSRKNHVFALVTDPSATGVGISKTNPLEHPAWIAGYGTLQPVEQAIRMAREMKPDLRRIGTVYNASEANSEAQLVIARKTCGDLGIELQETTIDNSSGVGEATGALCARGAEAIFMPGDVTVLVASDALISAAGKGGIPVFTVIPPQAKKGAIFDLGADYYEVGRHTGQLAAEILGGRSPSTVEIRNFLPESLVINEQAIAAYASKGWSLPESLRARAQTLIARDGTAISKAAAPPTVTRGNKPANLQIICFSESLPAEETLAGIRKAMASWPLKEGVDYTVRVRNAQGDIAALNGLFDAALAEKPAVIIPLSTPALQVAAKKVKDCPVVFSMVANPMAAGAVKSYEDHPANMTGVTVLAPAGPMLDLITKYYPQLKRFGTLYCPAEANSVDLYHMLQSEAAKRNLAIESVAVASPGELADAAMSLASKPIDAILQISDNLTSGGFTAISRAARQVRKPLFSLNSTTIPLGSAVVMGRDYEACGEATAALVLRILQGESPAGIPVQPAPRISTSASLPNAKALDMALPPGLLGEMDKVIEK
ncbi:MAG: ABC transporter substrate-binding protein [Terrimicrobiaceae bacterium]